MSTSIELEFNDIEGWQSDDHIAALTCFRISAKALLNNTPESRPGKPPNQALLKVARKASALDLSGVSTEQARKFFETHFKPVQPTAGLGFVTAYFEPEVEASSVRTQVFSYPLYKKPPDLVKLDEANRPKDLPAELAYARNADGRLIEYYDRKAIDEGALQNQGLELAWLRSPIEGFYIHVQGSARLIFSDGNSMRVSYAGKTGHPYTSIGRELVKDGVMTVEQANMTTIRQWLEVDRKRAMNLLHRNKSFIFFTRVENAEPDLGPVAAAGVQLTPGRSLAVDREFHAYGTPVWISTKLPLPSQSKPFRRLMVAQDTGSAIIGAMRGDLFIGSGKEAGDIAGSVRHDTDFITLQAIG